MNNIYKIAVAFVLCLASSCAPDMFGPEPDGQYISFSVSVPGLSTKTPVPGENIYNENTIKSIYYFFYPEAEDNVEPVLHGSFSGLNFTSGSNNWTLSISQDAVNRLFPTGHNKCRLFVVANPPQEIISALRSNPTYGDLKSIDFSTELDGIQDSFVMTCNELFTIGDRMATIGMTADAGLRRIANKLTFKAIIKKSHIDSEFGAVTWSTQPEGLRVAFVNGMNKTNLSGDFALFSDNDVEDSYFESSHVDFTYTDGGDNYLATVKVPLYSYPMIWDFEDRYEPYILFELPVVSSTGKYETCYYKYMLSEKRMTSNRWYEITANLNVLGSFFRNEPTQRYLRQDYLVLDWNEAYANPGEPDHNVEADIETSRYLVFNQTVYEIYDETTHDIPFLTSHTLDVDADGYIKAAAVSVAQKPNYGTGEPTLKTVSEKGRLFKVNGSVLTFTNELNNTIGNQLDCTPWTFTVTVNHHDNTNYKETITVIQYPSIYIRTEANSAGRTVSDNVYVNGSSDDDPGNYGGIRAANNEGNNSSIDMTIISVGRLGQNSEFTIGDPRNFASNWSTEWSTNADGLTSKSNNAMLNRKLRNYYPTYEDDSHQNYIAPKFRTSSANSRLKDAEWSWSSWRYIYYSISYGDAKKRCASYQEDGYPAGRWRLPTYGEVKFIINLSANGFIPTMFYNGQDYWCAGGFVTASESSSAFTQNTTGNHYVRCVYDEWYWEQIDKNLGIDHKTKTFYWGDVEY